MRAPSRALPALAAAGAAITIGLVAGTATASAHVHVDADHATPGETALLTFRVPGESETGALTTQLSVTLPDVASARAEVVPGWASSLDRDRTAGTVRSVTWSAQPGTGISSDQFALFRVSVKMPDQQSVSFPVTQTYSDGTVVHWDQPPLPDGGEPQFPAPVLAMDSPEDQVGAGSSADTTARWLAGGALILAASAAVTALLSRRRS
ncbi:YcnI family copper-binding membrane protein [Mycolicibacterium sp. XJ1819]